MKLNGMDVMMKKLTATLLALAVIGAGPALSQNAGAQTASRTIDPEVYDPNGLFTTVDANNDGQLSLQEYAAYVDRYAALGDITSINIRNNEGYEGVFRHYDKDNSGALSREELGRASRIDLDASLAT